MTDNATDMDRIELTSVETWELKTAAEALQQARAVAQHTAQQWMELVATTLVRRELPSDTVSLGWHLALEDHGVYLVPPSDGTQEEEKTPA